ncbi:MAG TPA: START domain-containing protein, partial [Polyangia bacterium]
LALPGPPGADAAAWQTLKTIDGVTLSTAPSDRAAPWGRGDGEIAAPIDRVIAHLLDFPSLGKWMPRVADLRVIARGDDEAIVYFRFDLPWPISDRDWTLRYRWKRDGNHFVMTWTDANERGPPPGKAVRVTPMRGYWELTALPSGATHARYVFLAELGGSLPHSVATETAWKQPLGSIRGVRLATTSR